MAILLTKGSRGELVKRLQAALNLVQDGIFGAITEEAVKAFQKTHGLVPDGIVGEKTWAIIVPNESSLQVSRRTLTGNKKEYQRGVVRLPFFMHGNPRSPRRNRRVRP